MAWLLPGGSMLESITVLQVMPSAVLAAQSSAPTTKREVVNELLRSENWRIVANIVLDEEE
eukprot:CAMPEP_0181319610 /NCGR_PEP_ID=MMETSP1101-20121128/17669_1 /TAXON_ID=46948 /ORGANISM="Rhodomonas abbreviata, Strain Caron Lab Isolate" /LENGTH=60 /DNA_ID=CAMNT_0023427233 /DNA_START=135 /DNA_END=314 /DNA_ORIENTATION=-